MSPPYRIEHIAAGAADVDEEPVEFCLVSSLNRQLVRSFTSPPDSAHLRQYPGLELNWGVEPEGFDENDFSNVFKGI